MSFRSGAVPSLAKRVAAATIAVTLVGSIALAVQAAGVGTGANARSGSLGDRASEGAGSCTVDAIFSSGFEPAAVAPGYCASGGALLWHNLEICGWPGPANTGVDLSQCPCGLEVNSGDPTRVIPITQDNTVINCQKITGSLDIQAQNVSISNSQISYDGGGAGGSGVIKIEDGGSATVEHVEIDGLNHTHACVWHQGTSMVSRYLNCHGINDGIFSWADTGFSQTTGDNFTIEFSYFHDLTHNAANGHIDGYQTEGANNGLIHHNTYDMNADANSSVAIWDSLKSSNNITVEDNLMSGGDTMVYAEDYSPSEADPVGGFTVTNTYFIDNKFSNNYTPHTDATVYDCVAFYFVWFSRPQYAYGGGPTDGWHRSGNYVLETQENLDNGNPHYNGQLCT